MSELQRPSEIILSDSHILPVRVKEAKRGERDLSKVSQLFPTFQTPVGFWVYDLYAIHVQLFGPLTASPAITWTNQNDMEVNYHLHWALWCTYMFILTFQCTWVKSENLQLFKQNKKSTLKVWLSKGWEVDQPYWMDSIKWCYTAPKAEHIILYKFIDSHLSWDSARVMSEVVGRGKQNLL